MANSVQLMHHMLTKLIDRHSENNVEMAISLWQSMAIEIMAIIGEAGFNSLYARSLYLSLASFPWLQVSTPPQASESRFSELRLRLESQTLPHAMAANHFLLKTFTDLLAKLIGEKITVSILASAWGSEVSYPIDTTTHLEEEFGNE